MPMNENSQVLKRELSWEELESFAVNSFLHVKDIVRSDFIDEALLVLASGERRLDGAMNGGRKQHYLYTFPASNTFPVDLEGMLKDDRVLGDPVTMSQRHLMQYEGEDRRPTRIVSPRPSLLGLRSKCHRVLT